jgi:secreted PhoX family phosphatase
LGGIGAAAVAALLPSVYSRRARAASFGPLQPDPDGICDLPSGFSYRILETKGNMMSDGYRVPGSADGMAVFPSAAGTLVLMRNHEVSTTFSDGPFAAGQSIPPESYDATRFGGVTRLVVDATSFARVSSNLVLVGTDRNCAGGPSPWGWLSCEESTGTNHGYVFLCSTSAATVAPPDRIDGYGRFNHEAACVDPATLIAYLTEDRGDSAIYRFVPTAPSEPFVGQLQAMKVVGFDRFDTSTGLLVGDTLDIEWVDIDAPTPSTDSVRVEAQNKGALVLVRGEGIWFYEGSVYICSTSGGPSGDGQIFRFTPDAAQSGGVLELIAQSTSSAVLDNPDNITIAPWGEVFMAEDGGSDNYIRGIDASGGIFDFARTTLSEFAGVCFSPDGRALFVNIQGPGHTLVITGPFPEIVAPDGGAMDAGSGGSSGAAGRGADASAEDAATADAATGGSSGGPSDATANMDGSAAAGGGTAGASGSGGAMSTPGSGGAGSGGAPGPVGAAGSTAADAGVAGDGAIGIDSSGDDGGCGCDVGGEKATSNAPALVAAIVTGTILRARLDG